MDHFPTAFHRWWNRVGSKLPYTEKCVALAAYQYGRASITLESRPTVRPKRAAQQLQAAICMYCDGVGWIEGGKTLQTTCPECKGTGKQVAV